MHRSNYYCSPSESSGYRNETIRRSAQRGALYAARDAQNSTRPGGQRNSPYFNFANRSPLGDDFDDCDFPPRQRQQPRRPSCMFPPVYINTGGHRTSLNPGLFGRRTGMSLGGRASYVNQLENARLRALNTSIFNSQRRSAQTNRLRRLQAQAAARLYRPLFTGCDGNCNAFCRMCNGLDGYEDEESDDETASLWEFASDWDDDYY